MTAPVVTIEGAERPKSIPIRLVGQDYVIEPPKAAIALRLSRVNPDNAVEMARLLDDWLEHAFGEETSAVRARLDDLDDDLDLWHLIDLMQKVIEVVAGNPSMSSSASSASPATTGGRSKATRSGTAGRKTSKS